MQVRGLMAVIRYQYEGEFISLCVFNDREEVGRLKKYWGEIKFTSLSYGCMYVSKGFVE